MAFTINVNWEVRSTGSDSNGGGFDPISGVPGTDYSQQDSPQITFTDMVIDGTTNTKFTSAGNPVTAAMVGNIINVTSGTGFTVQRVQILSQSAGVATCDKSLGTLSSTGGHGNLGGGLATLTKMASLFVQGNTAWVKSSATYTLTAAINIGTTAVGTELIQTIAGYTTTHGDKGQATITTATNSVDGLLRPSGDTNKVWRFLNLHFTNTATTRGVCLVPNGITAHLVCDNCIMDGFVNGINGDNVGAHGQWSSIHVSNTEIKNSTGAGILCVPPGAVNSCIIGPAVNLHDNTGAGIDIQGNQSHHFIRSIFGPNNSIGIQVETTSAYANNQIYIEECTIRGNTGDGIKLSATTNQSAFAIVNSIVYGNGGYGIDSLDTNGLYLMPLSQYNAFGANTSGDTHGSAVVGANNVTLTASPFVSSSDSNLNSTAGGGAACKGAGLNG